MNRNDIIQKIANLRALGTNNTSEAEAMAALSRAERLMHSYRVDEAEIAMAEATGDVTFEIVEEVTKSLSVGRTNRVRHRVQMSLTSIKQFTETECVIKTPGNQAGFTGDRPDVEMALYLVDLIRDSLDKEYNTWRRLQPSVGSGAKGTFQAAMAARINERLDEMTDERTEKVRALSLPKDHVRSELTSTALVVASISEEKKKEVNHAFTARYPRLGKASGFTYGRGSGSAFSAGRRAGDNVNFGRPLSGTKAGAIAAE